MPRYKVSGTSPFNGYEPGSQFTADIPADQEKRAIARGSIEKVAAEKPKAVPDPKRVVSPFESKPEDADE